MARMRTRLVRVLLPLMVFAALLAAWAGPFSVRPTAHAAGYCFIGTERFVISSTTDGCPSYSDVIRGSR